MPVDSPPPTPAETPAAPPPLRVRQLGPAGILAIFAATMPVLGGGTLVYYSKTATEFLQEDPTRGVFIYMAAFAVLAGLALLPTYVQAAIGGFVFGVAGIPAALVGFVGGSIIGYEIARRASGDRIELILKERPKWRAVRDALVGRGFWPTLGIIALVRLPPNSPFSLTNLVLSSAGVKRLPFLLGTLLGMAPRTAVAVLIGAGLDKVTDETLRHAVPWPVMVAGMVLLVGVIVVIGRIARKAIERATKGQAG